ncbi:Peroxisomal membrane associated protein 20 [Psilocybe cubensis]|uniref:Peroxisomal membrane associated protein 20 n=2 Tax=Psilocybe cubensis TaxID=181762 RepID=A0ACB8GIY2_PSICU|nr:Peroxisomal membrane associated protein 20 [Psilocybe cubensis]KAH9475352.1 Peroxisomal membrane associated protein 20 [Psilocybe cubensis]
MPPITPSSLSDLKRPQAWGAELSLPISLPIIIMSSIIASAGEAAHSFVASLLAHAQINPGDTIPKTEIKEDAPDQTVPLVLTGKNVLIGVPGAFTTPCNGHIPPFIESYEEFKAKGVNAIYIFGVNDTFVTKAWKEKLAPNGTREKRLIILFDSYLIVKPTAIHFIADDKASFVSSVGLAFDASGLLGGIRSKRFAIVTEGDKVVSVAVEEAPPNVTVTSAQSVLASL